MITVEANNKNFIYQRRHGLVDAIARLTEVVEYNLIDSGFADLREDIETMITSEEAEEIIDYLGFKGGIPDIYLLIEELQKDTDVDLSLQNVLFIMMAPYKYIEDQLNIDEDTAIWLYQRLHSSLVDNDLLGFINELLFEAANDVFYRRQSLQ